MDNGLEQNASNPVFSLLDHTALPSVGTHRGHFEDLSPSFERFIVTLIQTGFSETDIQKIGAALTLNDLSLINVRPCSRDPKEI